MSSKPCLKGLPSFDLPFTIRQTNKQLLIIIQWNCQSLSCVWVLTSSGTPEVCVSLFPSVIVMITDGSRKKGLRPWGEKVITVKAGIQHHIILVQCFVLSHVSHRACSKRICWGFFMERLDFCCKKWRLVYKTLHLLVDFMQRDLSG